MNEELYACLYEDLGCYVTKGSFSNLEVEYKTMDEWKLFWEESFSYHEYIPKEVVEKEMIEEN